MQGKTLRKIFEKDNSEKMPTSGEKNNTKDYLELEKYETLYG